MQLRLLPVLLFSAVSWGSQIPMDAPYVPETSTKPTLSDLLTIENQASIFYSYARELELSRGLSDKNVRLTLFVPTNKAVMSLARKPHQDNLPEGSEVEITEAEYDSLVKSNVERWVSAHIVPDAPIALEGVYETLQPAKSITLKPIRKSSQGPEWSRVSLEDGIKITAKKEAINGDLYMIDGVISSKGSDLD